VAAFIGYQEGRHAPGRQSWPDALAAVHHLLLSHGWAMPILRRNSPQSEAGITLNYSPAVPASPSAADYQAARYHDGMLNRWLLDPLYRGFYPADVVADHARLGHLPPGGLDFVQPGDMAAITAPTDFVGLNYYFRAVVRDEAAPGNLPRTVFVAPESEWTEMGWEVYPQGQYDMLCRVHFEYQPRKVYITENGVSYSDGPGADGRVRDARRTAYLRDHFAAAHRAMQAGVPLAGYFVWTLLDNFEWAKGLSQRFGLIWVDFATQQRTVKDSGAWLREVIAGDGFTAEA
jgi:beta-glucosidase